MTSAISCYEKKFLQLTEEFRNAEAKTPFFTAEAIRIFFKYFPRLRTEKLLTEAQIFRLELIRSDLEACKSDVSKIINSSLVGNVLSLNKIGIKRPPDCIGLLRLTVLDLSHNLISCLPPSIGALSQLEVLNLNNNSLKTLPNSISRLAELKVLVLSNNYFLEVPKAVFKLASMQKLNLSYTKIKKISHRIMHLTELKILDIRDTEINSLPFELQKLPHLVRVKMERTFILQEKKEAVQKECLKRKEELKRKKEESERRFAIWSAALESLIKTLKKKTHPSSGLKKEILEIGDLLIAARHQIKKFQFYFERRDENGSSLKEYFDNALSYCSRQDALYYRNYLNMTAPLLPKDPPGKTLYL